ncbi:tyrosine-protein phosphatase [Candidatus Dependentiae bacterium]|nr:tyrosine-protein phosphatase [Candidatus Dependentiae bacterium]
MDKKTMGITCVLLANLTGMGSSVLPKKLTLFSRPHDKFYEIDKNKLFRSKQLSPRKLASYIKRFNIKTIINLRGENPHEAWWRREQKIVSQLGINFYNIAMSARRLPYKKDLLLLLHLYNHAPRPILIHCNGGADRTGEAAALWMLDQQNKSKKEALKQLTFRYGHVSWRNKKKRQFIKMWLGRSWAQSQYFYLSSNTLPFCDSSAP